MRAAEASSRRRGRRFAATLLVPLVFAACPSPEPGERELATTDVAPALEVETGNDPQASPPVAALTGVLPSDFPADLPLYLPASLVDFGRSDQGLHSVTLLTSHSVSRVRRGLDELLSEQGWAAEPGGADGATVLRKGGRQVRLRVENAQPGTAYIYEYPG